MILNSQRTLYGLSIQLSTLLNQAYKPLPNTTLNEKFRIEPNVPIAANTYPTLKYFTIGVGGKIANSNNNDYSYSEHTAIDAALYEHVPFVLRTINNDLSTTERQNYRFRQLKQINGIEYAAYYLKVIPSITSPNELYKISKSNDIHKFSIFNTNNDKLLTPVPRNKVSSLAKYDEIGYLAKSAKLEFSLTVSELNELKNVFNILYGTNKVLSEIGICAGIDKDTNGVYEANNVQVVYHVKISIETSIHLSQNKDIKRVIEIGGVEPYIE